MCGNMMDKTSSVLKLLTIAVLTAGLIFSISAIASYKNAKGTAVKYLQIINYNKETYQELKAELYDVIAPELQKLLFSKVEYEGANLPPIHYSVNSVRGSVIGCNHYVFQVNWTINYSQSIDSLIYIKDGVVYDAHRLE
ncbi:MAG TPA: hypothetical protein VEG39_14300 [Clostridia bacterium]|nr:hypothetical protein [Clostridia bacterium]